MAMIADAFLPKLAERLMSLAEERVVMILGVKDDLGRLRRRLERIQPKLEAAERRRIDDPTVAAWLRELKDIMYDVDDILDLCRVEGARLLDEEPSSVRCHFPLFSWFTAVLFSCFTFPLFSCFTAVKLRNEVGVRIRSINGRLDEMSKDFSEFSHLNLDNNSTAKTNVRVSWVDSRQISSGVEPMVVGREIEEATKQLVESLLVKEDRQKWRAFAIVGMGGIGKTTLAQKIYTNQLVHSEFTTRVWLCISKDFQKIEKLKRLIRALGGRLGGHETESELMELLSSVVSGKRFFLVLDDVWQASVWINLFEVPLQSAAPGSRVLVTTRSENVAKGMGAVIHHVQKLSENSSWELLCKSAFVAGEEEIHNLRGTGLQIVEKCGGLPLAIKAIAGVLSTKEQSKLEWEKVRKSHAWSVTELPEDVRGALYISYDDLPSPLKQCFLYFSLYPEDYELHREDLVRYWVAEGFVKASGDSSMEDLAEEYYKELIQRNVLQLDPLNFDGTRCTVHDLWRSLAVFLSQDEGFYGERLNVTATTKLRRLSIAERGERAVIPESVIEQKSLRTLFVLKSPPRIDNDVLVRLSFLRILVLNGSGIESVPDSLGNLIHLRLLDLDRTSISNLPESLGNLTNLQLLNLSGCKSLHTLPKGITRLSNLRHLNLQHTPLSFLPKGIGRLEQLNVLQGFVIGNSSSDGEVGCGLEELKSLPQLRRLYINNMQQAQTGAGIMAISNKPHLKELVLCHSEDVDVFATYTEEEINNMERLYEELVPPQSLEYLRLYGFIGRVYPSWMASASSLLTRLPYLTYLVLHNCISCQQLPPLGQLPLLRTLSILGSAAIVTIGPELLGVHSGIASPNMRAVFPKLELLKIINMPNWEEWSFGRDLDEDHADVQKGKESRKPALLFPRLYSLVIEGCPKLRALPNGLRHSAIKELHIFGAHCLRSIGNIPTLAEVLQLVDNRSLEMASHLPALRKLIAHECPSLRCVEKLDALQHIYLKDSLMERLPQWLSTLVLQRQQQNIQGDYLRFELGCGQGVLRRCLEGCPDWPIIQQIPSVGINAIGGGWLRYTKDPFSYRTTDTKCEHT